MARVGKIARLPLMIREELNRRLQDGRPGSELLPWLNGLPEAQEVMRQWFHGEPVKPQNLSDWRQGGFEEWLQQQDALHATKELAQKCFEIAKASGGQISEGMAAILGGELMTLIEEIRGAKGTEKLEALERFGNILGQIRTGDQNNVRLAQNQERLRQKDEEIVLARMDRVEGFIKYAADQQAVQVATGPLDNREKIARLYKIMFGEELPEQKG